MEIEFSEKTINMDKKYCNFYGLDRKKLEEELINEKLSFTKIWVDFVLKSTNKEWSSQQKKFIDALVENSRKFQSEFSVCLNHKGFKHQERTAKLS